MEPSETTGRKEHKTEQILENLPAELNQDVEASHYDEATAHYDASGNSKEGNDDEHFDVHIEDWLAKKLELEVRNQCRKARMVLTPAVRQQRPIGESSMDDASDAIQKKASEIKPASALPLVHEDRAAVTSSLTSRNALENTDMRSQDQFALIPQFALPLYIIESGRVDNDIEEAVEAPKERPVPECFQGLESGATLPGAYDFRPVLGINSSSSGPSERIHDEEEHLELEADTRIMPIDAFITETFRAPNEELLVIDGVTTFDPQMRQRRVIAGFLGLVAVVALMVGMITGRLVDSSLHATPIALPLYPSSAPIGNSTSSASTNSSHAIQADNATSAVAFVSLGNLSLTLAEAALSEEQRGISISPFVSSFTRQNVLDRINRTDTNYTMFAVEKEAKLFEGLDASFISKIISPLWQGHVLDAIENYLVEGQSLTLEEMYDGMVLYSLSGNRLTVQRNPLRVNNASISTSVSNQEFKNGVVHALSHYPNPLVPWIEKSTFDVLLETNELNKCNLSSFIAMVEASPDFKSLLELHKGDTSATTLFVPTNDALATFDLSLLGDSNMQQLLLNHVVSGNFVRRFWEGIPTGAKLNDTDLVLETQTGSLLHLTITDEFVTINRHAKIISGDRFSQQGVLHVIDKVLCCQGMTIR